MYAYCCYCDWCDCGDNDYYCCCVLDDENWKESKGSGLSERKEIGEVCEIAEVYKDFGKESESLIL